MRWPLRYQILVPFAGALLGMVLGVSLLDAFWAARRTQRRIEQQLHEVAQTLLDATFPLTDSVLKQTRGLSGAEFLLLDARGRLQAASLSDVDLAALPNAAEDSDRFRFGAPIDLGGRSYLHTVIRLARRASEADAPRLHILYPRDDLRQAQREAATAPLIVGGLLLFGVVAVAVALADRLSRPILELRRQLGRLVSGDFQPLPVPQRNDEMRDLICSVNALGDQLDELGRAIKRAERLTLLGQLSGGLAHQLRNSVAGARLAMQLHQRHCRDVDPESLAVALRQLTVTESHLQRFLTAGQPAVPRRAGCNVAAVVSDVASLIAPSCNHHNVDLQLPPEQADVPLWADVEQLRQLLLNLVLNAVEAAGAGGWARVELERAHSVVEVRVLDSGPGVPDNVAAHLFEPFATGKSEGIGLGLAVARQIVVAHGGTIAYRGGAPTCFIVRLPEATEAARGAAEASPAPEHHSVAVPSHEGTIA